MNTVPAQISALWISFIVIKDAFEIKESRFVEILRKKEKSALVLQDI